MAIGLDWLFHNIYIVIYTWATVRNGRSLKKNMRVLINVQLYAVGKTLMKRREEKRKYSILVYVH